MKILIWKTRDNEGNFLENSDDEEDKGSVYSMKNQSDEGGDSLLTENDDLDNDSLSDDGFDNGSLSNDGLDNGSLSNDGLDNDYLSDDDLDNGSLSDLFEGQESDGGGDLDDWCCEDDNIENSSACEEVGDEMEEPGLSSESEGVSPKRRKLDSSNTG